MNDTMVKKPYTVPLMPEIQKQGKAKAKANGKTFNVYVEELIRKDLGK
ncbi:hypothetical protein H7U05_03700 [Priestia megaterium]|nr:hypothetical protein [Priestia megaterium]MBY0196408.1 hypothetical protein [Priestia megaterium]